jgi:hypothetical protein
MNKAPSAPKAPAATGPQALRNANLSAALEQAASARGSETAKTADLFRQLELVSGLPGTRMNMPLAVAFAHDAARLGVKADGLIFEMAELSAEVARGATSKEFLPVCGVLAVGARAMLAKEDAIRDRALALLEEKADDPRFRVREAVPVALSMVGHKMRSDLAARVEPWMDRYFQAAAVILALAEPAWLETFAVDDHEAAINLLHAAFTLAHDAPRSAVRYPGHKALIDALHRAPNALVKRFGVPMFDRLRMWAENVKIPELRDAILSNLEDAQLKKPFADEIRRVKQAVENSKTPPRDPTRIIQGTRGRGKKRGRH